MTENKPNTKYCKHCGELIDIECLICPKCGKQIEEFKTENNNNTNPYIINNNASSSSASSSAVTAGGKGNKKRPWYLSVIGIILIAMFTGGLALIILIPMRLAWDFGDH